MILRLLSLDSLGIGRWLRWCVDAAWSSDGRARKLIKNRNNKNSVKNQSRTSADCYTRNRVGEQSADKADCGVIFEIKEWLGFFEHCWVWSDADPCRSFSIAANHLSKTQQRILNNPSKRTQLLYQPLGFKVVLVLVARTTKDVSKEGAHSPHHCRHLQAKSTICYKLPTDFFVIVNKKTILYFEWFYFVIRPLIVSECTQLTILILSNHYERLCECLSEGTSRFGWEKPRKWFPRHRSINRADDCGGRTALSVWSSVLQRVNARGGVSADGEWAVNKSQRDFSSYKSILGPTKSPESPARLQLSDLRLWAIRCRKDLYNRPKRLQIRGIQSRN